MDGPSLFSVEPRVSQALHRREDGGLARRYKLSSRKNVLDGLARIAGKARRVLVTPPKLNSTIEHDLAHPR